jgi:photosystem II stability/assembly factor-like uncharacterized protein
MKPKEIVLALLAALALGMAAPAAAGIDRFTPSSPIDGQILALAADPHAPGTLLAVTDFHGLFRSEDSGHSWSYSGAGLDQERLQGIAADPANPGNFYAVSVTKAFRSTDGGRHWVTVATRQDFFTFDSFPHFRSPASFTLLPGGPGLPPTLLVGTITRLQRSGDGGATWSTTYDAHNPTSFWALAGDPTDPRRVWLGPPGGGLLTSTDTGQTWTPAPNLPPEIAVGVGGVTALIVLPTSPVTILVASGSRLFKSTDGGATWRRIALTFRAGDDPAVLYLAYESQTPSIVYAASNTSLLASADAGETWTARAGLAVPGIGGLVAAPGTRTLYVRGFDTLERSLDRGRHWAIAVAPGKGADFGGSDLRFDPRDPARLYALLDSRAFVSLDFGVTWASFGLAALPLPTTLVSALTIDPAHPDTLYLATDAGVFRTEDGGATWAAAGSMHLAAIEIAGRRSLLGAGCGIWRSVNGGGSWSVALPCPAGSPAVQRHVVGLVVDPRNRDVVYAEGVDITGPNTSLNRLWKSIDNGATWRLLSPEVTLPFFDPTRPGRFYEVRRPGGLLRTDDGGRTYRKISDFGGAGSPFVLGLAVDPVTPTTLYAASIDQGVWRSTDGGVSWAQVNAGLARLGDLHADGIVVHPSVPHLVYVHVFSGIFQERMPEEDLHLSERVSPPPVGGVDRRGTGAP